MNTIRLSAHTLIATLLVGLTALTFAQSDEEAVWAVRQALSLQMQKNTRSMVMNAIWNDSSANPLVMDWLGQDGFRAGVGVSTEQFQRIQKTMQNIGENLPNDPMLQPIRNELHSLIEKVEGGHATAETQARFYELQANLHTAANAIALGEMQHVINETLTPGQQQKIKEFQISIMSEMPVLPLGMFEALDLTGIQKTQLDNIKKEMEPEFKGSIDKMLDLQLNLQKKVQEKAHEIGLADMPDSEEKKRLLDNIMKNLLESNPKFQQEMKQTMESRKAIADKLRTEVISGILTDAQRARLQELMDNPPDYIKKSMEEVHKQTGVNDWRNGGFDGGYMPGPDSWQPGQGIPGGYRIEQRNLRFPRGAE